jgi:hypothetical protein
MKFTSPVYSAVSGSIAGITYAHNRGGMYARARAVPIDLNTVRQQAIRNGMAAMVVYWSGTLSAAQRAAWGVYAANTPVTDKLGQVHNLTGQQMFLRQASIQQQLALSINQAAPIVFDTGEPVTDIASFVVAAGVGTLTMTVGGAGTSDTCNKLVQIGPPQNAGRTYFKGPWQYARVATGAAATTAFVIPTTLASADWLAAYTPIVGDNLPIRVRLLYDDGRLSTPWSQIITVT